MKQMSVEEMKEIQLPILKAVHEFCEKNKLRYSLSGGTMIGAVRHKGYIPWDDDIDIMLPRPDYDRLVSGFNGTCEFFRLISCETDKGYFQPYAKVVDIRTVLDEHYDKKMPNLGVYIDVFPVDGLPNDKQKREKYWKKLFKLRNLLSCTYQKKVRGENRIKNLIRNCIFYLSFLFPQNFAAKKLNAFARKKYAFDESDFVACLVFGYGKKEEMPHSLYEHLADFEFEGNLFKASEQYDIYLSSLYGDYMKLPPEDERKTRHSAVAYFL